MPSDPRCLHHVDVAESIVPTVPVVNVSVKILNNPFTVGAASPVSHNIRFIARLHDSPKSSSRFLRIDVRRVSAALLCATVRSSTNEMPSCFKSVPDSTRPEMVSYHGYSARTRFAG